MSKRSGHEGIHGFKDLGRRRQRAEDQARWKRTDNTAPEPMDEIPDGLSGRQGP